MKHFEGKPLGTLFSVSRTSLFSPSWEVPRSLAGSPHGDTPPSHPEGRFFASHGNSTNVVARSSFCFRSNLVHAPLGFNITYRFEKYQTIGAQSKW